MKKSFIFLLSILLLASCAAQSEEVADFQAEQQYCDAVAKSIANYLADFDEIEDSNVQIDGQVAVVGLNLAYKLDDAKLIALKKRIAADIKARNSIITRVAVNTAPDMFEKIRGNGIDEPKVQEALEKNEDEEIFVNTVPTL
jgi:hypothetical protein